MSINVLIIGGGAREHALGWLIAKSPKCGKLFFLPGNAGTAELGENLPALAQLPAFTIGIASFLKRNKIDLVVVGPEAPLAAGLSDYIRSFGFPVFGPSRAAAEIEASKTHAKRVMRDAWVPTAPFGSFCEGDVSKALRLIDEKSPLRNGLVVKIDGLAGGKGVTVCDTIEEAKSAADKLLKKSLDKNDYGRILIEERFRGKELSLHALSDGTRHILFPPAEDYKKAWRGEDAPNTGGMGVIAPSPWVTRDDLKLYEELFVKRMLDYLRFCETPFAGCLYPGLMLSDIHGPMALEYNVRFGDPEAQALVRLWNNSLFSVCADFLSVLYASANGTLNPQTMNPLWGNSRVVSVTLAAKGYPGDSSAAQGAPILGITKAEEIPGVVVSHAGTKIEDGKLVVAGGRVLSVTATADSFREARERAYEAVRHITFGNNNEEYMHFRDDIGLEAEEWEAHHQTPSGLPRRGNAAVKLDPEERVSGQTSQ